MGGIFLWGEVPDRMKRGECPVCGYTMTWRVKFSTVADCAIFKLRAKINTPSLSCLCGVFSHGSRENNSHRRTFQVTLAAICSSVLFAFRSRRAAAAAAPMYGRIVGFR